MEAFIFEGAQTVLSLEGLGKTVGMDMPFWMAAFLAGSFAAVAMDLVMMVVRLSVHSPFSMPVIVGSTLLPNARPRERRTLGTAAHLLIGSFFGVAFTTIAERSLVGELPLLFAAVGWGVALWLVTGLTVLPLLKRGLFGEETDDFAWAILLLGHLVYGLVLGLLLPFIFLSQ